MYSSPVIALVTAANGVCATAAFKVNLILLISIATCKSQPNFACLQLKSAPTKLRQRSVIEILQKSLQDKPNRSLHGDQETYDEVRYKLVIDPSEDDSLSRLLLMYKILDPKKTRTFMCSDFPEDSQLQKVGCECVCTSRVGTSVACILWVPMWHAQFGMLHLFH